MAISKIILNGVTQMDVTQNTVNANNLFLNETATGADGEQIIGAYSPSLQSKTNIAPTETSQTITPDSGYEGLSSVQVNAISSTYVGSGIARKSSSDLTTNGATVTVPAGYYSTQGSKNVDTMTLPTSTAASATSGYTSKATVSRSTSDQYINIPSGYNSAGGYYKVNAVPNGSVTAPSTISGTTATVSTGTNTLTLTKTVSVTPNVTTAGYISSGTAGNASVSLQASVTTKAAATITPTTGVQTIAAGTYLTGIQTIAAIPSQYIIPSGNKEITANGTNIDVANYSTVSVDVPTGPAKNIQAYQGYDTVSATSYTATDVTITVAKTGTYNVSWIGWRNTSSGTSGSQLYKNGTAVGSANTTFQNTYGQNVSLTNQSFNQDDVLVVRARARSTSYVMAVGNLIIEEVQLNIQKFM